MKMADENDSISIGNAIIVMGVSGAGKSLLIVINLRWLSSHVLR